MKFNTSHCNSDCKTNNIILLVTKKRLFLPHVLLDIFEEQKFFSYKKYRVIGLHSNGKLNNTTVWDYINDLGLNNKSKVCAQPNCCDKLIK